MNIPNRYKGFSRLPENVQQRMDPELAQRYEMGGPVMQRPLFRQMGGPAEMMPQDAMAAAPETMSSGIMSGDDMASMALNSIPPEVLQAGQMVATDMMDRLDSAEDMKTVIDTIRGDEQPLAARYSELAEMVGPEDAQATPESVLALVQPTLMLSENSPIDDGVGGLMEGVAGNLQMDNPDGSSPPMAEGLGSLMVQGAGNTPPVNFSQGGPVRLQGGGDASLQSVYQEMLPLYQSIMGDSEEQRRAGQAQALFAISDAAGRFAAGQGAGGQDLRGLSPAAQLAGAMTGLGSQFGEIDAANRKQEQSVKLAALQAAQSDYSATKAAAAAAANKGIGDIYEVINSKGELVATVPLTTQVDFNAIQEKYPGTTVRKQLKRATPDMLTMVNPSDLTSTIAVNKNDASAFTAAVEGGFVPLADAKTLEQFKNPDSKPISLYKGKETVFFDLSIPEHKERYRKLLEKPGWTNNPAEFTAEIQKNKEMLVFKNQEQIKETNQISQELRQQGYLEAAEDREFADYLRKRELTLGDKMNAEDRAKEYEAFKFKRDQEATVSQELRQQGYLEAAEDREFIDYLRKRELTLETTLNAEQRAKEYEAFKFKRDQEATVSQELRQQGYTEAAEDREFIDYLRKRELTLETTLNAEQRAKEYDAFKFKRDQEATLKQELRQQGYTEAAENRNFIDYLQKRELTLETTLNAEQRAQQYDAFKFERDQSTNPVKGIPRDIFDTFTQDQKERLMLGDPKDPQTVKGIPRDIFDLLSTEQQQAIVVGDQSPGTLTERMQAIVQDVDLMNRYGEGKTTPAEDAKIQGAILELGAPRPGSDAAPPLPVIVREAEAARALLGFPTQTALEKPVPEELVDNIPLKQYGGASFGTGAFIRNIFNAGYSVFFEGAPAEKTKEGLTALNSLNESAKIAFRNMTPGRAEEAVTNFSKLLPEGAKIVGNRTTAISEINALIEFFKREVDQAQKNLQYVSSGEERRKAEVALEQGIAIIKSYDALRQGIEKSLAPKEDIGAILRRNDKRQKNSAEEEG